MSKAGLDNRYRNEDDEISQKHGNTLRVGLCHWIMDSMWDAGGGKVNPCWSCPRAQGCGTLVVGLGTLPAF
jgi:hypothetical protein